MSPTPVTVVTLPTGASASVLLPPSPPPTGKPTGVVVVQEWWGVTPEIIGHADTLSRMGHVALIPDLYRGTSTVDKEEASHLMGHLDFAVAAGEIADAAQVLRAAPYHCQRVAVLGFCMGGALAVLSAGSGGTGTETSSPPTGSPVDAVVCFYGTPGAIPAAVKDGQVPLQGHFGMNDSMAGFSDPEAARTLAQAAGVPVVVGKEGEENEPTPAVYMYEGETHGFMNPVNERMEGIRKQMEFTDPHPENQALAWKRVDAFLKRTLE